MILILHGWYKQMILILQSHDGTNGLKLGGTLVTSNSIINYWPKSELQLFGHRNGAGGDILGTSEASKVVTAGKSDGVVKIASQE